MQVGVVRHPALGVRIEIQLLGLLLPVAAALPGKHSPLEARASSCGPGHVSAKQIQNPNSEIKQVRNIKRKTKARISGFETLEFCNSTLFRASDFVLRILLWIFAASFS
jgi:hypothetical protein